MSVNRVILLGNVGQDPRVKYFDTGSAVATFPFGYDGSWIYVGKWNPEFPKEQSGIISLHLTVWRRL